ncbi:MAG: GIY-YIG nuclease family protein [Armatimonadota bacterium]
MPFFVYALRSESTGRFYIGTTNDVQRRLAQHQAGQSKATRGRGPWRLVHTEQYETLREARKREHYLKHSPGAGREKRRWIAGP